VAFAPQNTGLESRSRPWWMTALAFFCAATVVVTLVSDLFVPAARNTEVWFGFAVTGPLALATSPIHWTLFAIGAWAAWTNRPWIVPYAAGYLFYVAFCHLVWSVASPYGRGLPSGIVQAVVISSVGGALLQLRRRL
jgi:hypothetical protein